MKVALEKALKWGPTRASMTLRNADGNESIVTQILLKSKEVTLIFEQDAHSELFLPVLSCPKRLRQAMKIQGVDKGFADPVDGILREDDRPREIGFALDEVEQVSAKAVCLHYSEGIRFDLKDVLTRRAVVDSFARTNNLKTFSVYLRRRIMNRTRVPTRSPRHRSHLAQTSISSNINNFS